MPTPTPPGGFLARFALDRPAVRAWVMYDWANSAMVTLVVTAVFPIFFARVAAAGLDAETATSRFTLATTIGLAFIAVLSPMLGALADISASKLRFLAAFVMLGVSATGAMFFIQRGDWLLALVTFMVANIGLNGSFVFYDALLPHVANAEESDRVSSAGYALGYLGGGLLLAVGLMMIQKPEWFGLPHGEGLTPAQASLPTRITFVLTALWWGLFSVPLFRNVPEPPAVAKPAGLTAWGAVRQSFGQLGATFRELRSYRDAFIFLLAFLIYNDGIGTIIRLATIFGTEIGIGPSTMIGAILVTQFVGIPFAFLFGSLAGRIGTKPAIFLGIAVYAAISLVGYFMRTDLHFLLLAVLVGTVQGGTQALSRSLFSSMIPAHKSGEFFGFYSVFEKGASILGPLVFWVVQAVSGSSRNAILSLLIFFAIGAWLLSMVDVKRGQAMAREAVP